MSGYVKVFSSILDSTVWLTPPHVRLVWITMLAMADRDGVVEASVPGLANRAGVSRAECDEALAHFGAPDPDSRTPDEEGRRIRKVDGGWELINHAKYRARMDAEERRERDAARKTKKRAEEAEARADRPQPSADVRTSSHESASVRGRPPMSEGVRASPSASRNVRDVSHAEASPSPSPSPGESEPPAALGPKSSTKTWIALADMMRKAIEAGARAAQMPAPIECSEPDHRAWTECARQALELAEAKGVDARDVMRLAAEEAVLDMPRRAWKVRHLAEDFVALVSAEHIERRAKVRGSAAA